MEDDEEGDENDGRSEDEDEDEDEDDSAGKSAYESWGMLRRISFLSLGVPILLLGQLRALPSLTRNQRRGPERPAGAPCFSLATCARGSARLKTNSATSRLVWACLPQTCAFLCISTMRSRWFRHISPPKSCPQHSPLSLTWAWNFSPARLELGPRLLGARQGSATVAPSRLDSGGSPARSAAANRRLAGLTQTQGSWTSASEATPRSAATRRWRELRLG